MAPCLQAAQVIQRYLQGTTVTTSVLAEFRFTCLFDFSAYPSDRQVCPLTVHLSAKLDQADFEVDEVRAPPVQCGAN